MVSIREVILKVLKPLDADPGFGSGLSQTPLIFRLETHTIIQIMKGLNFAHPSCFHELPLVAPNSFFLPRSKAVSLSLGGRYDVHACRQSYTPSKEPGARNTFSGRKNFLFFVHLTFSAICFQAPRIGARAFVFFPCLKSCFNASSLLIPDVKIHSSTASFMSWVSFREYFPNLDTQQHVGRCRRN